MPSSSTLRGIEPFSLGIISNLAAAALMRGGKRLTAALDRWTADAVAIARLTATVRRRIGVEIENSAIAEWLQTPDLVDIIEQDPARAVGLLSDAASRAGTPLADPAPVFAAVLAAIAVVDEEIAAELHRVNVVHLLDELQVGLEYVYSELLTEILGLRIALGQTTDRTTHMQIAVREMDQRVLQCWTALGVPADVSRELADDIRIGVEIPAEVGAVLVVTAVTGSGKTLTAIRTHQLDLADAALDMTSPIPVLLDARSIGSSPFRDVVVAGCSGIGDPRAMGARVIVDCLDEIDRSTAQRVVFEAAAIAHAWPNTSVLIFDRPDVTYHGIRSIELPLPDPAHLEKVASRIVGRSNPFGGQSPSLRDAVRLPLYAIAASVLLRRDTAVPLSRAAIIAELVRIALQDAAVSDAKDLRRLAVASIESGSVREADFGAIESARAARSRLVVRDDGVLRFALSIFRDWFAAQAVLDGGLPTSIAPDDPWTFDSWRHALALALSFGAAEKVDEVTNVLVQRAGAGLQLILNESTSSASGALEPDVSSNAASRASFAIAALFSNFEQSLAYAGERGDPGKVHIEVDGAWARIQTIDADGRPVGGRGTRLNIREPAWPWRLAADEVTSVLESLTDERVLPIDHPTVHAENAWALARLVTNGQSLMHPPIDATLVLDQLSGVDAIDASRPTIFRGPRRSLLLPAGALEPCIDAIRAAAESTGTLERPWVAPDNPNTSTGWIDDLYRPATAARLLRDLEFAALAIYKQLVETCLSEFASYLPMYSSLPCLVRCTYTPRREHGWAATMSRTLHPLPVDADSNVVVAMFEDEPRFDFFRDHTDEWQSVGRRMPPYTATAGGTFGVVHGLFSNRPATHRAFRWLMDDFAALAWRDRMVPSDDPE